MDLIFHAIWIVLVLFILKLFLIFYCCNIRRTTKQRKFNEEASTHHFTVTVAMEATPPQTIIGSFSNNNHLYRPYHSDNSSPMRSIDTTLVPEYSLSEVPAYPPPAYGNHNQDARIDRII